MSLYLGVFGGYFYQDNANIVFLDSTEIMVKEKIGWKLLQKHPLPHPMKDLRGISLQNKIFMIGKNLLCISTQILPYNDCLYLSINLGRVA